MEYLEMLKILLRCSEGCIDNILKDMDSDAFEHVVDDLEFRCLDFNFTNILEVAFDDAMSFLTEYIDKRKKELEDSDDEDKLKELKALNKLDVRNDFELDNNFDASHINLMADNADIYTEYLQEQLDKLTDLTGLGLNY